jgi:ERCC4-type nuclease
MKVIIDERENDLYDKCFSIVNCEGNATNIQLIKQVLPIGDILIRSDENKDIMIIERKSFQDLLSSIKDGRYEEQSYRLTHSSGFPLHSIVYVLEGMFSQLRNVAEKKLVYSCIASLNYFKGFSVMKTSNTRETAELMIWMANKIDRDMIKGKIPWYLLRTSQSSHLPPLTEPHPTETSQQIETTQQIETIDNYCTVVKKNKKENITPENIGEILLCQIPGISSVTAISIMKNFNGFPDLLEQLQNNPTILDGIQYDSNGKMRKINKTCIVNIKKYLCKASVVTTPLLSIHETIPNASNENTIPIEKTNKTPKTKVKTNVKTKVKTKVQSNANTDTI